MSPVAWLVFARCAGFVSRAPGFSHPSVPRPVRVGIAVFCGCAIVPPVHPAYSSDIGLFIGLAAEFLLGSAMGIAAALLYDGAYAGGRMIDDYVGVKAIAPNVAIVAPSGFGRVWSLAFTGGYFLLGAYAWAIEGLAHSFVVIPPGIPIDSHAWSDFILRLVATIAGVAAAVAGPAVALALVTQIALAALSRTVPRFSSFTLSFPIVFGVVLIVTAVSIPIVSATSGHPILMYPGDAR
jgi:flagellar biosynthesis protein FliR